MPRPENAEEWERLRLDIKAKLLRAQEMLSRAQRRTSYEALRSMYEPAALIAYVRAKEEEENCLAEIKRLGVALIELDAVMIPGWAGRMPRDGEMQQAGAGAGKEMVRSDVPTEGEPLSQS